MTKLEAILKEIQKRIDEKTEEWGKQQTSAPRLGATPAPILLGEINSLSWAYKMISEINKAEQPEPWIEL